MNNTRAGSFGVALAVVLSLAGLAISGQLLVRHAELDTGRTLSSFGQCRTQGQWSCDDVLKSRWAYFPFGRDETQWRVPTAQLGFFYFAVTSAWFLTVGRVSGAPRRAWHWLILAVALGGTGFGGWLDYVMWTRMPTFRELGVFTDDSNSALAGLRPICSHCLATHIIAGVLLIVTLLLRPRRDQAAVLAEPADGKSVAPVRVLLPPVRHPSFRTLMAFAVMACSISAAGTYGYKYAVAGQTANGGRVAELEQRLKDYDDDYQAVYFNFMNEPVVDLPVTADDIVRGKPDAPHTIVMFTDLQCPFCREADRIVQEKVARYPDRIRLVVRHFPLNSGCNPYAKGKAHAAACAAAITVEAARNLGGDEAFWKMYDELFAHQDEFAKGAQAFVKEATARAGIDHDELWKKIRTRGIDRRILLNVEQAHSAGVDSTPTLYFDGRRISAWANGKFWDYLMHLDKQGTLPVARQATAVPASMPGTPPVSLVPAPASTQPSTAP